MSGGVGGGLCGPGGAGAQLTRSLHPAHCTLHTHTHTHTHTHGAPDRIKKRIEDLIEREFLARVEGQPSQYAYIA